MAAIPEHTVKVGNIQLAIWNNKTDKGGQISVSIDKSYKSGDEWKRTKSFNPNDLVKVQLGITKVLEYLYIKDIITPEIKKKDDVPF